MNRLTWVPLLLTLTGLPLLAAGQASAPLTGAEEILKRMDRDNDGKIAFEEYRNAVSRRFHALDANVDGVLHADEIPREWLEVSEADLNGDGLTIEELSLHLRPVFDGFDTDRDGRLDQQELEALARARAQRLEKAP